MKIDHYVDYYLEHHKNPYLRIVIWGVLFLWMFWAHGWFERGELSGFIVLFFWCLANLAFYYIFSRMVYPAIRGAEWLSAMLWCFVLYILLVRLMRLPYNFVLLYRPELGDTSPYNMYSLKSVGDVFSKTSIVVFYVGAAWVNLVTILLFAMRRVLLASKARQESLQARNAMEIGFLRAQVQPHFLFNTLNNIYGLLIEQEQVSRMVLQLSDLLRYTLYNTHTPYVALDDEVGFMANYLELEATRLRGQGIEIQHNLSGLGKHGVQITPLLLIQVIEYALQVAEKSPAKRQQIRITLETQHVQVSLRVERSVPEKEALEKITLEHFADCHHRLESEYPGRYTLEPINHDKHQVIQLALSLNGSHSPEDNKI